MNLKDLSDILIPEINITPEYYKNLYPKRNLRPDAMVTRYAPSPTGFQHLGGVFAALISERLAHQSGGIFYLRIEDTDKKREVSGAIEDTLNTLINYGIKFDEGVTGSSSEKGEYAPYKQSDRNVIYKVFIKDLIAKGLAYPCFCTEEELESTHKIQTEIKTQPGYYGKWAKCRNKTVEDIVDLLQAGKPYVIRLKSPGNPLKKIICEDLIKGGISMPENDQDIVILKSDGLPTYHFAHAVDDSLMGTTHVIRGEEWLPSLPLHLQLFEILGFTPPHYGHIPTIMKIDGTSKRKLSKRKDPEAAVEYYKKQGYPSESVIEYLLNIINSNFEDWRSNNTDLSYDKFPVELNNIGKSGALFDIIKLEDISKNIICKMNYEEVLEKYLNWSKEYDTATAELLLRDDAYSKQIFNIEREIVKPRKDFAKWLDVRENIEYFFDDKFELSIKAGYQLPQNVSLETAKTIIKEYIKIYSFKDSNEVWFSKIKELCTSLNYSTNMKTYKKNPELYNGSIVEITQTIRATLTNKLNTPNLFDIMQVLGEDKVIARLKNITLI